MEDVWRPKRSSHSAKGVGGDVLERVPEGVFRKRKKTAEQTRAADPVTSSADGTPGR